MRMLGNTLRMWLPKPQTATLVVAASNSLHPERADYHCDGTADDVQIQNAIDALPASGGRIILLDGAFNITATIAIPAKSITLQGQGRENTTIFLSNNSDCHMISVALAAPNVRILDLELDGNKANQAGTLYGIFWRGYRGEIGFVYIEDVKGHGVILQGDAGNFAQGNKIDHVEVYNCDGPGFRAEAYAYDNWWLVCNSGLNQWGFYFDSCNQHLIGGSAWSSSLQGIQITGNAYICRIEGMLINDNGAEGIRLVPAAANSVDKAIIIGNHIWNNSQTTPGTSSAIGLDATNANILDIVIEGNVAWDTDHAYFVAQAGTNTIDYITVRGNTCREYTTGFHNLTGLHNRVYNQHSDLFMDVLAVSATHVRSNEDLSAGLPITFTIDAQPDIPRTLSGHFDAHVNITAYTIVITGVDARGNTVVETMTEADGWDWETNNAFATITSIIMTARTGTGVGDTMDIGITDVLGLSNIIYATSDVYKIKKNNANAVVAGAQVDTTYDTYDMAVIGLAATDDFTIWFRSNLNIIS